MKYSKKKHILGFWQANPMPGKEELERYYSEVYFQTCSSLTYAPEYTEEEKRYFHNRALVSDYIWRRFSGEQTGSFIDIGCGEGFFVKYFAEHEWKVKACDFSSCGIERHNPQIISCFTQGNIYQILEQEFNTGSIYDFINLSNVLEHVTEPIELLDKVKNVMHKNTLLRICVPNDYSEFQGLLVNLGYLSEDSWFGSLDHLNYFTMPSLEALLVNRGFSVSAVLADFPIEMYLMNEHSNYWADKSKGKQAHLCRIKIDNFLVERGVDKYIDYMSAAARCGLGRSIIAFTALKNNI